MAYVVDPINQTRGFFQWRDGGLAQVGGYYLTADRGDRVALARLVNDLEKLPNPEGGGGGVLSPRLEAELINMLTRPAQSPVSSPVERLQLATLFGMLGTFLGILGVALALWLYQLQGRIQDQSDSLSALVQAVERMGDSQRLANDALVRKLDTDKPEEFVAQYSKAVRERDEAARLLAIQRSMSEDLGARNRGLDQQLRDAQKELDQARRDVKETPELRKQVTRLEELNDEKQAQLDLAEPVLGYKEGTQAMRDVLRELQRTRYVAYAGWGLGGLLAAGLAVTFFFYKPTLPDADTDAAIDPAGTGAADGDRPTHRIV